MSDTNKEDGTRYSATSNDPDQLQRSKDHDRNSRSDGPASTQHDTEPTAARLEASMEHNKQEESMDPNLVRMSPKPSAPINVN
jgi:hypothetical protein